MYINLILAVFWLVLGLALLLIAWHPTEGRGNTFGVSSGWVALLLAAYNVLRFARIMARRTPPAETSRGATKTTYDTSLDFSKPSPDSNS